MATISNTVVNNDLRVRVFNDLLINDTTEIEYRKINDRQYGAILTDLNGNERYVRIGVIVAEEREDQTARELMQTEIDQYNATQERKAAKAAENAEKAARDAERRAAKAAEKAAKEKAKEEGAA